MPLKRLSHLLLLVFLSWFSSYSLAQEPSEDVSQRLMATVEDLLASQGPWDQVQIDVSCQTDTGYRSVHVFGRGVGIWNRERQFSLDSDRIIAMLDLLQKAGFAEMRQVYGGGDDPQGEPSAVKIICSVGLTIGDLTKYVLQREKGSQSKELKELANDILKICEELAPSGTAVRTLAEGLAKITQRQLAPETLELLVHRKIQDGTQEDAVDGWLMRIEGSHATTQTFLKEEGYSEPFRLELTQEALSELAVVLLNHDLQDLPVNLYAPHYTDLAVQVLNREKNVQARQFSGMTPTTYGERQTDFEKIYQALHDLHSRVLQEGEPAQGDEDSEPAP